MSHLIHSKEIPVSDEHLDQIHHVNNVQYVHWVEEIAVEHWELLKNKTKFAKDYWVLVDHHI
ncbi:acyl-CoA thioesterase family protein [Chryseobacterium koreense]|uniref:acyl-ACP thioesterase domain-containing protein n=1 Tax=Chryseobacterium koreense TaxID=232216 RepID=UPI000A55E70C|nr:acyl-ACP thioesterase domain-containing protein [Chryseobacterium koreense]MBB5332704.1 acyl-CoA thioester hydrolase [Chryseobacterium koreense]